MVNTNRGIGDITKTLAAITNQIKISDDFAGTNFYPWGKAAIASGTVEDAPADLGHYGIKNFKSSTSANSGYRIYTEYYSFVLYNSFKTTLIFKTVAAISTTSIMRFGFVKQPNENAVTDGVWVDLSGTTLIGKTALSSTASDTATSYTVSANTWYRLVAEINATATLVTFKLYVDNSDTLLWSDTLATNIPTNTNLYHALVMYDTGTTAVSLMKADYMDVIIPNARRVV